jgi:hypothetical protein
MNITVNSFTRTGRLPGVTYLCPENYIADLAWWQEDKS